jgi:hypothetical protein
MRSRPLLFLASCFASLIVFGQTSHAKPKVAVLGLEVAGPSATDKKATDTAKALTRELRREAGRPKGPFEPAPNSEKDLLEMKLLSDCSDEGKRCMAEIGKQLKAERLLYGRLERTRRGYAVSLRLLDTQSSQLVGEKNEVIPYGDLTPAGLQRRARSLYGSLSGAQEEGELSIAATADRGTVYVDGQIRTSLSAGAARVSGLSSGVHSIAIEARGFERYEAEVDIDPGETRSLRADMVEAVSGGEEVDGDEEERPGGGWRIAFWSSVIAAGAAGAGWTVTGISVNGIEKDVSAATPGYGGSYMLRGERTDNGDYKDACFSFGDPDVAGVSADDLAAIKKVKDLCDKGQGRRDLVNFVWIPATVGAAIFAGFAYYKGYIAPKSSSAEREARRRGKRHRTRLTVAPTLGPDLVGAGLELTF